MTQAELSKLLGRDPRRNEDTFVKWLEEWLRTREQMEPDSEWERRTR